MEFPSWFISLIENSNKIPHTNFIVLFAEVRLLTAGYNIKMVRGKFENVHGLIDPSYFNIFGSVAKPFERFKFLYNIIMMRI